MRRERGGRNRDIQTEKKREKEKDNNFRDTMHLKNLNYKKSVLLMKPYHESISKNYKTRYSC